MKRLGGKDLREGEACRMPSTKTTPEDQTDRILNWMKKGKLKIKGPWESIVAAEIEVRELRGERR